MRLIKLADLPLSELVRLVRARLDIGRDLIAPGSVPVFGLAKGTMAVEMTNQVSDITLGASATWAALPSPGPIKGTIEVTGLSDLWISASGTVARSGATSDHALSFLVNGTEYTVLRHGLVAGTTWGLTTLEGAVNQGWSLTGRIPAGKIPRGTTTIELVYRRTVGANTGLIGTSSAFVANLYAWEY